MSLSGEIKDFSVTALISYLFSLVIDEILKDIQVEVLTRTIEF